jgi:hypothetical protein
VLLLPCRCSLWSVVTPRSDGSKGRGKVLVRDRFGGNGVDSSEARGSDTSRGSITSSTILPGGGSRVDPQVSKQHIRPGYTDTPSDWPESCIVTIAVLKGMPASAYNLLIGFMAVKFFLLLSICSFFLRHRKEVKSYSALVGLLHTRLLVISVLAMLAQTFAQSAIRVKSELKDTDSPRGVALLAHITALALLLTFICHHVAVGRTHSRGARRANGLSMMVRPRDSSADFDTFARRPTLRLTSYIAECFQDCRDAHVDSISESGSSKRTRDTTVISLILAAACVIIIVSSHHLVDSIALEDAEQLSTWQRLSILLTTSLVGLTECVAVCVNTWRCGRSAVAEEVNSAALGSTARLLSALVSLSTIIGWSLGMEALVLPIDAFHYALLVVALLMQWISEGW